MNEKNFNEKIIIGAGIAGLTAASKFKEAKDDFIVFEKENHLGGTWQSFKYKDSVFEFGPNTIIDKSQILRDLIKKAGLESESLFSNLKDSKRYYYRGNKLIEVSAKPHKVLFSKLLSLGAKLRVLAEPFIKSKSHGNESVFDFFSRRFGHDFAKYIVGPALQGVWGGDIKNLNMSCSLANLFELEKSHGSVLLGLIFSKKAKKKQQRLQTLSFKKGLEDLCVQLGNFIGNEKIKTNSEVLSIEKEDDLYKLKVKRGQNQEFYFCKKLYIACPANSASLLLKNLKASLSEALSKIYYAPIHLVAYSIPKESLANEEKSFDAFGFLNSNQSHFTLGSIFASSLFKIRNLKDEHLCVSFLGGSKNSQIIDFDQEELNAIALNEAKEIFDTALGTSLNLEDINFINAKLIRQAIPQYNDEYKKSKAIIDKELQEDQSLILLGNYMNGVSIIDTVEHAYQEA